MAGDVEALLGVEARDHRDERDVRGPQPQSRLQCALVLELPIERPALDTSSRSCGSVDGSQTS